MGVRLTGCGRGSDLVWKEAERIPVWVEHHADVLLELVLRKPGSRFSSPGHALIEVLDGDVEMHHHLLLARRCRPDRREVVRLVLERQPGPASNLDDQTTRRLRAANCSKGASGRPATRA